MKKNRLKDLTFIAIFCALLSLSAMIYIPAQVPITLQTLVLFLAMFILGGKRTIVLTLLYIALGAVGAPVFSGFTGGIFRLFDASGGFIFGFAVASLVYWLSTALGGNRTVVRIIGAFFALLSIYATGTLWYAFVYLDGLPSFTAALAVTVLPFVIPDIVKLYIAYLIAKRIPRP